MSDGPSDYARAEAIESGRRDATWPRVPDAGGPGKHAVCQGAASAGVPLCGAPPEFPGMAGPHFITKDSGQREEFSTGSRRDTRRGKGRFDLISTHAERREAQLLERGAEKYGERNWEKGQPMSRVADSMKRHLNQWLAGDSSEDHAAAIRWGAGCLIHFDEEIRAGRLPAELRDAGPKETK